MCPSGLATRFHRARRLDRTTEQQKLFGQRGFARIGVGNDSESSPGGDFAAMSANGYVQK
jgi:hypothetical protein